MAIKLGDALVMIGADRSKLGQDFKAAEADTRTWVPKVGHILEVALGGLLRKSIEGLTSLVGNFGKELLGTVQKAAKVSAVTNTFERLVDVVGGDAVQAINDLRYATRGMVSDSDLMSASNKFLAMGLADSIDEASKMAEIATQLGTAMGTDATTAMEDFALMLANQSTPRLDTFGISSGTVRTRIEELMAANEEMTREQAFSIATMEQAEIAMKKVGEQGGTVAASLSRIKSGWDNVTTSIGKLFMPIAEKVLGWVGDFISYLQMVFEEGDTLNDFLSELPEFLQPIAEAVGKGVKFLKENLIPTILLLFDAFSKLLSGDVSGFWWGLHDALVALGIPEEKLVSLENVIVTIKSAFDDLKNGNVEEFIGKMKAALLELGVPVETVEALEKAFRKVYDWWLENVPKIKEAARTAWEEVFKPALEGLLSLVQDLLPGALIAFGAVLLIHFVGPILLAALPVVALGAALIALGLIWKEHGEQVKYTVGQIGVIVTHIFTSIIEVVRNAIDAITGIEGPFGDLLRTVLGDGSRSITVLDEMIEKMRTANQERAEALLQQGAPGPATGENPFQGVLNALRVLGVGNQNNSRNVTVYGGVQQYGTGGEEEALQSLWELGQ